MKINDTAWATLTLGERIKRLELEGYLVYPDLLSPEQVARFKKLAGSLETKAGSAVFLNHRCFHGNCPNVGSRERDMLAYLYRPAWAGPVEEKIELWPDDKVATLPPAVRRFFADPNVRKGFDFNHSNKPATMRSEAPGISPDR
jgi:hypothetical protein